MKNKLTTVGKVAEIIKDGDTIMCGGFIQAGVPEKLIDAIIASGAKDLTVITNDTGKPDVGVSKLITAGRVKKVIASHIGLNPESGEKMKSGELEVELVPQGTLAERLRAGGFGLGGILTPTGIGTDVAKGKQVMNVDGKDYLLEKPLRAKIAFIKGSIIDKAGNVFYYGTTRNFNPLMPAAADIVFAEADEIIDEIEPENVHTQGIFVDYIIGG